MAHVCLVMAAYKGAEWIEKVSVPSLLKQTYKNWRLYIVYDGFDQEEDYQKIEAYIKKLESFGEKRVTLERLERILPTPPFEVGSGNWNIAGYNCMNHGLDRVKKENDDCKYIFHLDQDDCYAPIHLDVMKNHLDDNKFTSNLAYSQAVYYVADEHMGLVGDRPFNKEKLMEANYIAHSSIGYKAHCRHQWHYSGETHEPSDWGHLKGFLVEDKPFIYVPRPTVLYFQRCSIDFAVAKIKELSKPL